jgi:hypothetical protein
LSRNN